MNPLRIAVQGVGLIALSMATMGFISDAPVPPVPTQPVAIVRSIGGTGRNTEHREPKYIKPLSQEIPKSVTGKLDPRIRKEREERELLYLIDMYYLLLEERPELFE